MLLDLLVDLLFGLFEGLLAMIPSYTLDASGLGGTLGSALAGANSVFPVTTLGLCIALVIGARVFIAWVAFLAWVWTKIPFLFR